MRRTWIAVFAAVLLCAAASVQAQGTLPAGTAISVTVDQTVSSKDAQEGQRVAGSVAENITVNGKVVIPKGAKANLAVASVESAGKLKGQAKLSLKLVSVEVKGKTYTTTASWFGATGAARGKRTAVGAGGGAAAGAVIGAIAGGGKGAAIGAVVGAGAGTAGAAMTGKTEVEIRAESKVSFRLKTALTVQ
ncbi:MAG: hypothetical protein HY234_10895 [Acidobacteria bacterium]|nr:hypothetical protein [Acidobacteriota bacterium]